MSYPSFKEEFKKCLDLVGEVGYVVRLTPPIVHVSGLPGIHSSEIVYFESGEIGMVFSINLDTVEILLFSSSYVTVGTKVSRSNNVMKVPVGDMFLGKTIDPLGKSVHDSVVMPRTSEFRFLEDIPAGIEKRKKITLPFETGVAVVDMLMPLGKGQRQLVLGDRKTGKTEFLMQTLLTQARLGTICIYACVGKRKNDVKRLEDFVKKHDLLTNTVLVSTNSTDPPGLIILTPYYAMTLAEYFRDCKKDVLLIIDDLSTHAKYYREVSLMGRRFPGRESYPGDIFYIHSRLLERAGCFKVDESDISITCLPVAETLESDISGYIQTNLMSITDGHLYFDKEMFEQGRRPAVNYFLSVTRVGRQTQNKLRWGVNRELSSFLTLLEKTQRFIHFGAELNEGIKATLNMGTKILGFFDQPMGSVVPLNLQIVLYSLIWTGYLPGDTPTALRYLLEKSVQLYLYDKVFEDMVNSAVYAAGDFNILLGQMRTTGKSFVSYIETHTSEAANKPTSV